MEAIRDSKPDSLFRLVQKLEERALHLFSDIIFILEALIEHDNRLDVEPERIQDLPKY